MSIRLQQIESQLQRTLSQVIRDDLADPRIQGMISITRVHVSPDLHEAEVYISVLPAEKQKRVVAGLRHAAGHIQRLTLRRLSMRTVPRLDFRGDDSLKKQAAVMRAIGQAMDRSGTDHGGDADADHGGDVNGEM